MYHLTVRHHFDAAHFLPNYPGKCAQLHGHRWLVEATVQGNQLDNLGMLVDFGVIKDKLKTLLQQFDHSLINDHVFFQNQAPTAENLARMLFQALKPLPPQVQLAKVRVYETPDAWVDYGEEQSWQA